jgi:hypothetical protein
MTEYPEKYWHCAIKNINEKRYFVVNDLTYQELQKKIIQPWLNKTAFTVDGKIINPKGELQIEEIKISQTPQTRDYYANAHNSRMQSRGILDAATNRDMLPIEQGTDYTDELLFQQQDVGSNISEPTEAIIERVCERINLSANLLGNRPRKGKSPYTVEDEYDVQDLVHAVIRAFVKNSVQENTISKLGGRSSRADITVEDLGLLIEVKYVRSPNDQSSLVEQLSQDLLLYTKWEPLKTIFFIVFNSKDLRDPEALEEFSNIHKVNGKEFRLKVILV